MLRLCLLPAGSRLRRRSKKMPELDVSNLIHYWESKLADRFLLEPSVVTLIEQTIEALKKLKEVER